VQTAKAKCKISAGQKSDVTRQGRSGAKDGVAVDGAMDCARIKWLWGLARDRRRISQLRCPVPAI